MMTLRQQTIEAIRVRIDPSQEGLARRSYEDAKKAVEALPVGTFSDEKVGPDR